MSETVLELIGVQRAFGDLVIIEEANLTVAAGEIVGLLGPSGSGKSSLLHIAGLLEKPSAGEVRLLGDKASKRSDRQRTALRRDIVGFVYQFHHLLPEFDALSNVALPRRIAGESRASAEAEAARLLTSLGLGERLKHQPPQLSGGEQQRVALARAVVGKPDLIIADEPTGNVDPQMSERIMRLFIEMNRMGAAVLVATHDLELVRKLAKPVLRLQSGRVFKVAADGAKKSARSAT